jgi:carnosine N-methyltransferase
MSHHRSTKDLLRCIKIPDENPADGLAMAGAKGQMSMVAGDFVDCYSAPHESESFNIVITIFFLDTAPNVLKYIDTIHNVLEPGGIWINLGPLAWHFEPDESTMHNGPKQSGGSVELTLDELLSVIQKEGFEILSGNNLDQHTIRTPYMGDSRGTLKYLYDAEFWVAKKVK